MSAPVTPLRPKASLSALDAQRLLDALPSAAVIFGPEGEVAAGNLRAEHLLAAPIATVVGRGPDGAFRLFRERSERIGTAEHARFVQPFGSLWYLVESFPLTVGTQTLRAVMATDITDMKSAEFEIRESEARLEEATRIAQLGTYKLYWDTGKVHWSPQV